LCIEVLAAEDPEWRERQIEVLTKLRDPPPEDPETTLRKSAPE
jgi:hypothetical protein